jgi:hypothetical protein
VIIDPSPSNKPADSQLPAPTPHGSAAADQARTSSGIDTPDPDPLARSKVAAALQQAGTEKPVDVPDSEIEPPAALTEQDLDAHKLEAGEATDGFGAGAPTQSEAARVSPTVADRETDAFAESAAAEQLATARQLSAESTAQMNEHNDATTDDQPVVVAKVTAPQSVDAQGKKVATSLSVAGDTITMHVDHKGQDVAYPIAADPDYEIVVTRWDIAWFPELKQETYISSWAVGQRYIGDWHPIYCALGWISCAGAGVPAWYHASQGGTHHVAYWPAYNWGPVWQDYYYPVYATRWVAARWIPYWAPDLSSAIVTTIIDSGGEEIYDGGDWDEGDVGGDDDNDAITFIAARAQKAPPCRRINWKTTVIGMGGGSLKLRYCWNRKKKKVSLDSQYDNRVDASAAPGTSLAFWIDDKKFTPHVLALNGGRRGALDAHAHFAFKAGVSKFGLNLEFTLQNVDWGVIARYDGSWCPYRKSNHRDTCGV